MEIVDVRSLKFDALILKNGYLADDGRAVNRYLVAKFIAPTRIKANFEYVNVDEGAGVPAHMKAFANKTTVIVWDQADLNKIGDGSTPFLVEVNATIATKGGRMVDGNVYLTIRPIKDGEVIEGAKVTDQVITTHFAQQLPKSASMAFVGRVGAVAFRDPAEFSSSATRRAS